MPGKFRDKGIEGIKQKPAGAWLEYAGSIIRTSNDKQGQ